MNRSKSAAIVIGGLFFLFALVVVAFHGPIYMIYKWGRVIPDEENRVLYHVDHTKLAASLREFAAKQRWNNPDALRTPNFYYVDDPSLPVAVRDVHPSWVQINDERVDCGFGQIVREKSLSFGISVWRPGLEGYGAKKLADGVWFYAEDGRVPRP